MKLPQLRIDSFNGEAVDHLKFHTFITQFNNAIGNRPNLSLSAKLTYLKGYLSGYAGKLVEHLSDNDANYAVALDLLNREFLNKKAIVSELSNKLFSLKCKFDPSYCETKLFISELRGILADLKIYDCDVVGENASNVLISNLIFSKLPLPFKQELARKIGNNYPSISQIFDNYVEVITTLNLRAMKSADGSQCPATASSLSERKPQPEAKQVFSNPVVTHPDMKACKFCFSQGHSMINCTAYPTYQSRKDRCSEIKICFRCSSSKHAGASCNNIMQYECKFCKAKTHISALCSSANVTQTQSNICLNSASDSRSGYILPTITLPVSKGDKVVHARFLIDTGSQRTYVSGKVLDKLNFPSDLKVTRYKVNTFLERGVKHFAEVSLNLGFLDQKGDLLVPMLVDEGFNLSFEVPSLSAAINNLRLNHKLADSSFDSLSDLVQLDGILGVDVIQCFRDFQLSFVGKGSIFCYNDAIIPFGNVEHFLSRKQALQMYETLHRSDNEFQASINFGLNPEPFQPDVISSVIADSEVEGKLSRMFQVESIGLSDESVCEADARKVDQFASSIQPKDGKYHVPLLWNEMAT